MLIESIINNIQDVGIFAVFLGILIAVHEWGHFITAKKLGVQVDEFAIGFGPTLFKKFYNGTNYMLKLFPLGGYVRMAGDERDKCTGDPKEFYSQPVGHRALIVFNGPLINFVLGYVCFVLVFQIGYLHPDAKIAGLRAGLPAQTMGLEIGDEILEINGQKVSYFKEIKKFIRRSEGEFVSVKYLRGEKEVAAAVPVVVVSEKNMFGRIEEFRTIGLDDPSTPLSEKGTNVVGHIHEDSPAKSSGLQIGDVILSADGQTVESFGSLQKIVREAEADALNFKISRNGRIIEMPVGLKTEVIEKGNKKGEEFKYIGVNHTALQDSTSHKFGFFPSFKRAGEEFVEITAMTYNALYSMITGTMSAKENFGGPILIYDIVTKSKSLGVSFFVFILGVISLNLAIFNLLPVIPLDGGHLFLMGLEKVKGSPLPRKFEDVVGNIGLSLIILLAVYVFYIDLDRNGAFNGIKGFVNTHIIQRFQNG